MSKKDKVAVSDSAAVQALDAEGNPIDLDGDEFEEDLGMSYHFDKKWEVHQEARGWYITAEGYNYVTVENQTFFDSEEEALAARVRLVAKVGGEG